jgi:hypothetical protein
MDLDHQVEGFEYCADYSRSWVSQTMSTHEYRRRSSRVVEDAMFDQREFSIQIVQAKGDSKGCVKDN